MEWGNIEGLIPFFGGIYAYLLAIGTIPKNPKDPEKMELWRKKFGKMIKFLAPVLVIFGILQLSGIL